MTKGSGMPQMRAAFGGWTRRITLTRRIQTVVDGLVTTEDVPFTFRGTVQPLSPKQIALKPEGQRAWSWIQIHCFSGSIIQPNDQIVYNNAVYKVMGQNDYSLNGFIEYHLVKDYQ
jgi:hypothetical protein